MLWPYSRRVRDNFLDRLEQQLRNHLGLPDDPAQGLFEGPDERGLYTLRPQTEEEQEASFRHFHEQPLLSHVIDEGFRYLRIASDYIENPDRFVSRLSWPVRRRVLERELAQTRNIRWRSWHKATPGETAQIDGYVLLPSGARFALDVRALAEQAVWAVESWHDGGVTIERRDSGSVETILCPVDALTPAVVEQAVRRWYMERFEWHRGHWAIIERRLPEFDVDNTFWEWPADTAERVGCEATVAEIDRDLAGLELSDFGRRLQRHYGLS